MTVTPANGKLLYDTMMVRVASQVADQTALVGRAKDLLSVATISGTVTGALLNDKLVNVTKADIPEWWLAVAGIALLLVIGPALYALRPQTWYFSPNFDGLLATARAQAYEDNKLYLAMTYGLADPVTGETESALDLNDKQIGNIAAAVRIEEFGIALLAVAGFLLAFLALTADTPTGGTPSGK